MEVRQAKKLLFVLDELSREVDVITPKMKELNKTARIGTVNSSFFKDLKNTISSTDMKLRFYFEKYELVRLWEPFDSIYKMNILHFNGLDELDHDWAYLKSFNSWLERSSDILIIVQLINFSNSTLYAVKIVEIDTVLEKYIEDNNQSEYGYKRRYELLMKIRGFIQDNDSEKRNKEILDMTTNIQYPCPQDMELQ